ncbi:MAG: hypothetical protein CMJ83_11550 [Planctomycetes bacterium]|nr:hypothetical protein [Planctomycetota bacterium]
MLLLAPSITAQPDEVKKLQAEVKELKSLIEKQRKDFESRIDELNTRVDEGIEQELGQRIAEIVAEKSKFYRRPLGDRRGEAVAASKVSIFDALQGGLIFTGLFRTRMEYRANNVDFNSGDDGLDDEGVRFNGRFRLGFGAVVVKGGPDDPEVVALTEFQATGTLSNNTYFSFIGPGGVPLPREFTIFKEPFEQVDIYQGYIDFKRVFADELYVKLGRQEAVFGNEFIFGNNSFYDGTVHDGIHVEWITDDFRLSGFGFKESQSDTELAVIIPGDDFDEDWLAGVYASWDVEVEHLTIDAYAVYFDARSNFTDSFVTRSTALALDGAFNPAILGHFWTLGARVFAYDLDVFDGTLSINGEAAFQTGSNGVAAGVPGGLDNQSIHGWSTELLLNYWFPSDDGVQPILSLSYYYAGGGEQNENTANGFPNNHIGFQPLFINRHFDMPDRAVTSEPYHAGGGRYGNMDLVPLNNTHVIKLALTIAPTDEIELGLGGIMSIIADDEGYGTGVFGYEVDLFGSYQYEENVRFAANLSLFIPQSGAEDFSNYYFFSSFGATGTADQDISLAFYLQALISF